MHGYPGEFRLTQKRSLLDWLRLGEVHLRDKQDTFVSHRQTHIYLIGEIAGSAKTQMFVRLAVMHIMSRHLRTQSIFRLAGTPKICQTIANTIFVAPAGCRQTSGDTSCCQISGGTSCCQTSEETTCCQTSGDTSCRQTI